MSEYGEYCISVIDNYKIDFPSTVIVTLGHACLLVVESQPPYRLSRIYYLQNNFSQRTKSSQQYARSGWKWLKLKGPMPIISLRKCLHNDENIKFII